MKQVKIIKRLSPIEFTKRTILSREPKRTYKSYKEPLKTKLIDAFIRAYQN
jgi:hypothetical protein